MATAFHQNDLEMQHFEVAKIDVACPFNTILIFLGTYQSHFQFGRLEGVNLQPIALLENAERSPSNAPGVLTK